MNILGVYDGHNANASIVSDGNVIAAVEEERFSRNKNHDGRSKVLGPPINAIRFCLEACDSKIDAIAYALEDPIKLQNNCINSYFASIDNGYYQRLKCRYLKGKKVTPSQLINYPLNYQINRVKRLNKCLEDAGLDLKKVPQIFIDHHLSHASSAYYTSPVDDCLIVTLDGKGDDLCGSVSLGLHGSIKRIEKINYINSIARLYAVITEISGFRPLRHEGKITGLAAYGKPNHELINRFREIISSENGKWNGSLDSANQLGPYPHTMHDQNCIYVKQIIKSIKPMPTLIDIAASVQKHLETEVCKFIEHFLASQRKSSLLLAGGVFANVKLNQAIQSLKLVQNIYIHPAMSDSGLSVGAALKLANDNKEIVSNKFTDAFLGPSYTSSEIKKVLLKNSIDFYKPNNLCQELADILSQGKVIARFNGKLEYGPRALGNRSILYQTNDITVNKWLNKLLNRTEFMPFAPITLAEFFDQCYQNTDGALYTSQFMTITFTCTQRMREESPAVVHLDGTARPQLVSKENNPSLHAILFQYYKITGIPSLINTSFNAHEEPIVCSPEEAIKSFFNCKLDYLQIGDFIVKNN